MDYFKFLYYKLKVAFLDNCHQHYLVKIVGGLLYWTQSFCQSVQDWRWCCCIYVMSDVCPSQALAYVSSWVNTEMSPVEMW